MPTCTPQESCQGKYLARLLLCKNRALAQIVPTPPFTLVNGRASALLSASLPIPSNRRHACSEGGTKSGIDATLQTVIYSLMITVNTDTSRYQIIGNRSQSMKCSSPITVPHAPSVGCGQCMSCRVNKTRLWTSRLLMESYYHPPEASYFTTLTYADENVPWTSDGRPRVAAAHAGQQTLDKRDAILFRKRLRKALGYSARYFFVGEYGDKTERPHYHAILFTKCVRGFDQVVEKAWGLGMTSTSWLVPEQMGYIAQYCTKKLTRPDDIRLGSRLPEFAQMSRRPALGDAFVRDLAKKQMFHVEQTGDISGAFRANGKIWSLGDRHKRMLRAAHTLPQTLTELRKFDPRVAAANPIPDPSELKARKQIEVQKRVKAEIFKQKTVRI
ncbi:MAG: replication initiator protein [Microvirus sp.]|nr:MAG: replication initiator protein [Microvirus sp.]